jgi:pimeloyl-ACP methyl ester carboxylesterase
MPQIEGRRAMAKHAVTPIQTIPPARDEESVRQDLRSQLLSGLPIAERRLSVNNLSTAVLEGGDGSPIVLLHGPAAYAAQWRRLIPNLVSTHRVIAPDLPGHGASEPLERAPDPELILGWLDDLIECTCDIPPVIVGHTLGGAMAARFAGARSDRLAALVLVDTLGLSPFRPSPAFGAAVQAFFSNPTERTLDGLWKQCLFDVSTVRTWMAKEWDAINAYVLDRMQVPTRLSSVRLLMDEFGMPAIPEDTLARIVVPTTLVWGREDRATPLSVAEAASTQFGWPLHVIDDAADDPTMDQPEVFLKTLREVLARQ